MRLSVLDQSVAVSGRPQEQSIRNTVALAQHCESLGYQRFWVSEHHNHPTIVGTAPEIVMAAIAATTQSIRIGSAGIMLPHYSPFKVAEVFRVLDAQEIGMDLTEALAMTPAASVSGFFMSHPDSTYFTLGKIGQDQVDDMIARSGEDRAFVERALAPNL